MSACHRLSPCTIVNVKHPTYDGPRRGVVIASRICDRYPYYKSFVSIRPKRRSDAEVAWFPPTCLELAYGYETKDLVSPPDARASIPIWLRSRVQQYGFSYRHGRWEPWDRTLWTVCELSMSTWSDDLGSHLASLVRGIDDSATRVAATLVDEGTGKQFCAALSSLVAVPSAHTVDAIRPNRHVEWTPAPMRKTRVRRNRRSSRSGS